jgi:hypothetical protein
MYIFTIYYCDGQMKDDAMGRAFSTHGENENCVKNFAWKT